MQKDYNKKRGNGDKENLPPPKRVRAQPAKKVKGTCTVVYRESTPPLVYPPLCLFTTHQQIWITFAFRCPRFRHCLRPHFHLPSRLGRRPPSPLPTFSSSAIASPPSPLHNCLCPHFHLPSHLGRHPLTHPCLQTLVSPLYLQLNNRRPRRTARELTAAWRIQRLVISPYCVHTCLRYMYMCTCLQFRVQLTVFNGTKCFDANA